MKFDTDAVHAGVSPDPSTGAIATPIFQTSTFVFEDVGKTKGYDYSRTGNPTRRALEDSIAKLEGGNRGFATASGMAAEATVLHLLSAGDHVVSCDDVYGGTHRLFTRIMSRLGIDITFIRMSDREKLERAIRPETKMVWVETPSNPLLNITDLEMVASVAKPRGILTVVDNTFSSPYFLRPIDFGADLVVHSTTKYLNGHCDVIGGAIVTTTDKLAEEVQFILNGMGTGASPFDSWLVLRGIKTLPVRMKQHARSAGKVAEFLSGHPKVGQVYYPGLPSHPGHDIAKRQMRGYGGVVSFKLKANVPSFLRGLELFSLAESLGGPHSLVEHAATMSHGSMSDEAKASAGIGQDVIRLSIGLEDAEDILEDLDKGLKASKGL